MLGPSSMIGWKRSQALWLVEDDAESASIWISGLTAANYENM